MHVKQIRWSHLMKIDHFQVPRHPSNCQECEITKKYLGKILKKCMVYLKNSKIPFQYHKNHENWGYTWKVWAQKSKNDDINLVGDKLY